MRGLNCSTCTYWTKDDGIAGNVGKCTRFPPQVNDDPGPPRFPMTDETMFCAEWSQNDEPGEDVTHGQLHRELENAGVAVLKAWHGLERGNDSEHKLEPVIRKLQLVLQKCRAW